MKRLCLSLALVLVCALSGCSGGSQPIALTLNFSGAQAIDNGQSVNITVTVKNDKGAKGVTWSLASAGTLSNITTTSVTYNAPAGPLTAAVTDHLTATSVADTTKSVTLAITNNPSPSISTTQAQLNSSPATVGTAYTFTFAATGGSGTLNWSATGLPSWLSISAAGVLSGTPPAGTTGTFNFTVTATDSSAAGAKSTTSGQLTLTVKPAPVLSITKTHVGNFTVGQTGANYTVTVSNGAGAGSTIGTMVTVTETVPSGLTLVSMAGTGWTCASGGTTCTRSDVLAPASSYPPITVTVNVSGIATSPQVNQVSVSGGGSASASTTDSTTIVAPVLTISKTHTGSFNLGQQGATYAVTVSNIGTAPTSGTVTVTETVPSGESLVSMAGTGWTCAPGGTTCTRTDALTNGLSYPAITVTVNVAANATSPQSNKVTVSGGLSASASVTDSTTILFPALGITKTHTGSFNLGQTGATYTVTVSNTGAAPTVGTVTVTETAPSGETLVSMAGTGWTCAPAGTTCTRTDALPNGSSYPAITVTVNVAANATSPQVNRVSAAGGGSVNAANASDPTTILLPVLGITKTHTGNFTQGQTGATYTVTVSNTGAAPTVGTVTVTDTAPSGETLVTMAGAGWTCVTISCTRADPLAAASSYPTITVTVNVASNAATPQVNNVSVSGGGSANANASDSTTIVEPVLGITKTHTGNFTQGELNATYTVTVSNSGTAPTSGLVTVTDTLPSGLTLVSMAGTGWTCGVPANACTRSDVLATASSYPPITVTVNVATNATTPQVNNVSVSGGGSANANASDSTIIIQPVLAITKTHTGNFTQGQQNATYTVTVNNNSGTAPTSGTVTVTETVPTGLTLVSMAGTGWTCPASGNTCTRSDALAIGASYPAITVTVNVGNNATSPQVNSVSVSGGGSANANASDSTIINALSVAIVTGSFTTIQAGATGVSVTASVTNDIGSQGVNWTLMAGGVACSPTCGSFSNVTTTSVTYTPPASVPGSPNNNPTITATSKADAAKSASFSFTITGGTLACPLPTGGQEGRLNGTYAVLFNGWNDGAGMSQAAASFTANGTGGITGGEADSQGVGVNQPRPTQTITNGCYTIAASGRGKMIWNFSGVGNSVTFSIAMRADGKNGDLIEFDDTTGTSGGRGSGSIRLQDPALFVLSTLNGTFAFGDRGEKSDGTRVGSIGVFTLDGVSALSAGVVDYSEPGTSFTGLTATGSFTAPDAHGRGTLTLVIANVPSIGTLTLHFAYYITRTGGGGTTPPLIFIQSTDAPDAVGHALLNGLMGKQTGGPFGNGSLNGTGVFAVTGEDTSHPGITNTVVGLSTSTGTGTFTGVIDQEADALPIVNTAVSGTISIGMNGLGTVQVTSPASLIPTSIVMIAPNTAFLLEGNATTPGHDAQTGLLQLQTGGGTFGPSSISGTFIFGSDEPATTGTNVDVGTVTITSPGAITITQDSSDGGLQLDKVMTGTYTMNPNGRGDITITSGGTGTAVIYLLGTNKAVVMPRGGGSIAFLNLEQ